MSKKINPDNVILHFALSYDEDVQTAQISLSDLLDSGVPITGEGDDMKLVSVRLNKN